MGIAHSFTVTDTLYQFDFGDGKKAVLPRSFVILTDDQSGLLAVKVTGSRKTLFLSKNNNTTNEL